MTGASSSIEQKKHLHHVRKTYINIIDKRKLTPYTFAVKNEQDKIIELLKSRGAMISAVIENNKKSKNKKKEKNLENKIMEKQEIKLKKYVMIKITNRGDKEILSQLEIEEFKKVHQEISNIIFDENKLTNIANEIPKE